MPPQTEKFNRSVTNQEVWHFSVAADGLYALTITARCKNWLQNARRRFNDDDLAVQVDDYFFADLKGKKREFNIIGSWNGNELKNAAKAVIFILPLRAGEHTVTFWTDKFPWIETIEVLALPPGEQNFTIPVSANGGVVDLILKNVAPTKISFTDKSGAKKTINLGVDQSSGIREFVLTKPGEPTIRSFNLAISADSIRYKIGRVKLYKDITVATKVNLRAESKTDPTSLAELVDGDEVEILDEREVGERIPNFSDIWHKVRYHGQIGYVLSSFIEIQGQERDKIIELIKAKCLEHKMSDANIMLAIATQESHFKPLAVSYRGAQGIFQLASLAAKQMKVIDPLNFYQNIDGGVRYYKWIEGEVTGRGDILEKRLVAWHSGRSNVPEKGPVDYSRLPHPIEARQFVKNVLENLKKKNWWHVITLVLVLVAGGVGFLAGQLAPTEQAAGLEPTRIFFPTPMSRVAPLLASFPSSSNQAVFQSNGYEEPKIITVAGIGDDENDFQTVFYYSGDKGGWTEYLPSYFVQAGWINLDYERKIFWIERSEGKYLPTTFYFYDYLNSHEFKKIKFISKNGNEREEISGPFDILSAAGESILREYLDSDSMHSPVTKVREYQYEYGQNVFRETGISERQLDLPT